MTLELKHFKSVLQLVKSNIKVKLLKISSMICILQYLMEDAPVWHNDCLWCDYNDHQYDLGVKCQGQLYLKYAKGLIT